MFVGNKKTYFSKLITRHIGVNLGAGAQSFFEGVGIMAVSAPKYPSNSKLLLLYPTFLAPRDDMCTISNGALMHFSGFQRVLIDTAREVHLTHQDGSQFSIPLIHQQQIDYIKFHIHPLTKASRRRLNYRHLSLQPARISHPTLKGTPLLSLLLHLKYQHRSIATLQLMINQGMIEGLDKRWKLVPLPGHCPICIASKATKLRRSPLKDNTPVEPGIQWHLDFTFFNEVSCRGFTSVLIIVEATSRNLWFFPCRHKSAPIDLCLYFFGHLQCQGIKVLHIRTDDDGALIGCAEFCKIMYDSLGVALESTGGYASSINGMAETPHRTLKGSIRVSLMGAAMINIYWCLCGQYAAFVYNQCINRTTGKVPAQVWNKRVVPPSKLYPFGARVKIIKELKAQRALSMRTAGDLRNTIANDPISADDAMEFGQLTQSPEYDGRFVGFSSHPNVMLVLTQGQPNIPSSDRLRRVHHAIVDEYGLSANPADQPLPHETLLRTLYDQQFANATPSEWKFTFSPSTLDTCSSPFAPDECEAFDIILPPQGHVIGISLVTDEDFMLPILHRLDPNYELFDQVPPRHHYSQSWIVQIHDQQPLTAKGEQDLLKSLQLPNKSRMVTITFCLMNNPERYNYQFYRTVFDSMTGPRYAHMATMPYTPQARSTFWECLDTEERHHWIQATSHQYSKNAAINLCSKPEPIEKVPKGRTILCPVLAPKVKVKGEDLYQFVTRLCANGSTQRQGVDYLFSWAPNIAAAGVRLLFCFAAIYRLILGKIDVVNCFQSTMSRTHLLMYLPPYYMQWFKTHFPHVKIEKSPSGKYVIEILKGIQGDRAIGREWYLLLKKILVKFGCKPCPVEPALYIYNKDDGLMLVATSTDDFLCAYSNEAIFYRLVETLKDLFDVTTETGAMFHYLNLRIIQSSFGIFYDQSEHIERTITNKFFPPNSTERLKTVHTPFRTDSQYEIELCECLPADETQLAALEKKYGGSYGEIIGQIMHVYVWSRLELGYSCSRLSKYTTAPSAPAFAGLYRQLRYLATHPHRPIIYPRGTIDGYHTYRVNFDPPKFEAIELPNGPIILVDSDHARDNATRRSCHFSLALLLGIVVDWKMAQQLFVALHSTDSEVRGTFAGIKRGLYLQDIIEFLGITNIFPTPVYGDSQPCIDILQANTVTTRVKHIAVPIHWIHQQIALNKFTMCKIGTHLNMADSGTKPTPAPVLLRHFDQAIGVRFYPPSDSEHAKLMELSKFVRSPFSDKCSQLPTY